MYLAGKKRRAWISEDKTDSAQFIYTTHSRRKRGESFAKSSLCAFHRYVVLYVIYIILFNSFRGSDFYFGGTFNFLNGRGTNRKNMKVSRVFLKSHLKTKLVN